MKPGKSYRESLAMTGNWRIRRLLLLLFTAICFQLSLARAVDSVPTVRTDKPDYPPGDTARMTGTGFLPGEQVECQVLRLDATFESSVAHLPWLVAADASGQFQTSWFVTWDAAGAALELAAVGQTSCLVASVAFTDSSDSCPPPPAGTPLTGTPAG